MESKKAMKVEKKRFQKKLLTKIKRCDNLI